MTVSASSIWARLAQTPPVGDAIVARPVDPSSGEHLLAAVDTTGRRHLLVHLQPRSPRPSLHRMRGLDVALREYTLPSEPPKTFVDVTCLDPSGHDAFDLILGELSGRIAQGHSPSETLDHVLARWRRFWSEPHAKRLSVEGQIGLFGELWFLHVWLAPAVGIAQSISAWRGPFGARHDFELAGVSVEAKTTSGINRRVHRISGLDQLSPPTNGGLLLFSLQLRDEGGAANSLPELVDAVRRTISDGHLGSRDSFDAGLAAAGYDDAHDAEYLLRWRVVSERLYSVADDFPRLLLSHLACDLPAGVSAIEYDIDVAPFEHCVVSQSPRGLPSILGR
ncbi:MAG: PD-(D/E)XK motif protein [Gemmatimonadaceae bacterium]